MSTLKILSVAVANGRAGYVYISEGDLKDWQISVKAVRSVNELTGWVQGLINELKPDVVVTEKITKDCRKGTKTKRFLTAVAELTSHNYVLDVQVPQPRRYACKYTQAQDLAKRYPQLMGWLPKKRRYFESEPRNIIIFEALALAEEVIFGPPEKLAAAMG